MISNYEILCDNNLSDHNVIIFDTILSEKENKTKYENHYLTDLIKFNIDDATPDQWDNFREFLEYFDISIMESMTLNDNMDMLYTVISDCATKSFDIKEKFMNLPSRRYIPQEVRKLLRRKLKLEKRTLKNKNWKKNLEVENELEEINVKLD